MAGDEQDIDEVVDEVNEMVEEHSERPSEQIEAMKNAILFPIKAFLLAIPILLSLLVVYALWQGYFSFALYAQPVQVGTTLVALQVSGGIVVLGLVFNYLYYRRFFQEDEQHYRKGPGGWLDVGD